MQFYFHQPIYMSGLDGVPRIVVQTKMMAELSGSPQVPDIDAIYAFEEYGDKRFELKRGSPEYLIAMATILTDVQERERIKDEWPEDELPVRRYAGHEHSTHWGRP